MQFVSLLVITVCGADIYIVCTRKGNQLISLLCHALFVFIRTSRIFPSKVVCNRDHRNNHLT